jgi:catechol 2,3-dioxygenase-like lactoylglutathione lyase family enzyme
MSSTEQDTSPSVSFTVQPADPTAAALAFEVTRLYVTDVDRAKAFYVGLGWRMDIDFTPAPGMRAVQITPPGSPASIQFGSGGPEMAGPLKGMILVSDDIEAARADLVKRGADVSEIWHLEPGKGQVAGRDPNGTSYASRATFQDPDGNEWTLQEVTQRLPGRVDADTASIADLLHETAIHHGSFEAVAPPHDWWDWYAAYFEARQGGITSDEAAETANRYMAEVKHVVVQP